VEHFLRVAEAERQLNARVTAVEGGQQRDHVVGRVGPDAQLAAGQAAGGREQPFGLGLEGVEPARDVEQPAAQPGQLDAPPAPLEQLHAVALLQRLDLAREGRLRDVQRFGRPGVAARRRDGVEGPQLCRIH
jgi:hypothetical protein